MDERILCYNSSPMALRRIKLYFIAAIAVLATAITAYAASCPTELLHGFATSLENVYKEKQVIADDELKKILGGDLTQIEFHVRSKKAPSIYSKLERKVTTGNIETLTEKQAHDMIRDGIGLRLVLKEPTQSSDKSIKELTGSIIGKLIPRIENGSIQVTKYHNYHGPSAEPYLDTRQFSELLQAISKAPKSIDLSVKRGSAYKESGYTGFHLNIILPSGIPAELQIRGEIVDHLAEIEHLYYDNRRQKEMPNSTDIEFKKFISALEDLTARQREDLNGYLANWYAYARQLELENQSFSSTQSSPPRLPDDLNPVLSIENAAAIQHLKL